LLAPSRGIRPRTSYKGPPRSAIRPDCFCFKLRQKLGIQGLRNAIKTVARRQAAGYGPGRASWKTAVLKPGRTVAASRIKATVLKADTHASWTVSQRRAHRHDRYRARMTSLFGGHLQRQRRAEYPYPKGAGASPNIAKEMLQGMLAPGDAKRRSKPSIQMARADPCKRGSGKTHSWVFVVAESIVMRPVPYSRAPCALALGTATF